MSNRTNAGARALHLAARAKPRTDAAADPAAVLAGQYARVRARTEALAKPLSAEDCQVQSMPDASPVKWHLAHVTWFFETFVLERFEPGFSPFHPAFRVLYNSYYQGVGEQHPRPRRGMVTRPALTEVRAYREQVDRRVQALLAGAGTRTNAELLTLVELGLQHEQQHQELVLTDLKHLLSCNPVAPVYRERWPLAAVPTATPAPGAAATAATAATAASAKRWTRFEGGIVPIGHDGEGFHFDNEAPAHRVLLTPYALAQGLVTHGDWLAFIDSGGYVDPRWWTAAGWDWVRAQGLRAPMYWEPDGAGSWTTFTLHGRVPVDAATALPHLSWFEADAYARWRAAHDGAPIRLPTESEWEHAARAQGEGWARDGHFLEGEGFHPLPPPAHAAGLSQMAGEVWQWTVSAYLPYPGYRPWAGAVGEYNGKFMVNQMVLRGASCATPCSHARPTYRNFFPTDARWQFSGLRLARDEQGG